MDLREQLEQWSQMNNRAVQLFEKGHFHHSLRVFNDTLTLLTKLTRSGEQSSQATLEAKILLREHPILPEHVRRFSKQVRIQATTRASIGSRRGDDPLFIHSRAVYLLFGDSVPHQHHQAQGAVPIDSFASQVLLMHYHVTYILYNIALCYQALSLLSATPQSSSCDQYTCDADYSQKAISVYNLSIATLSKSVLHDDVLVVGLYNNAAALYYGQGQPFEATKCWKMVRGRILATMSVSVFEPGELQGLYLNSLVDSSSAPAA